MYISNLRIKNYKSFLDSGDMKFAPGVNIIIGPNNAGKTALLEALSLKFENKGHRSEKTQRRRSEKINDTSVVEATIHIEGAELRQIIAGREEIVIRPPANGRVDDAVKAFNLSISSHIEMSAAYTGNGIDPDSVDYGLYKQVKGSDNFILAPSSDGKVFQHAGTKNASYKDSLAGITLKIFTSNIYRFFAERPNVGRCPIGYNSQLEPNASNLAEVLQVLQTKNTHRFERFNRLVTEIFPSVKWVSAVTEGSNAMMIDIKVWPIDRSSERDYLALPLTECGTGVGQALAILYIIVNSEEPRVIIIDEPQSFLHPGAARKLMELLNKHPEHQYFISTHSPELLAAARPSTITSLKYSDGVSVSKSLTLKQTGELKSVLDEVGVKFSDVFFAEDVLWVEGPTEYKTFPLIVNRFAPKGTFSNVTILPLTSTGDLKSKKHARLVFDIYAKLSGAHALVPLTVGVILDREGLSNQEEGKFKKMGKGLLELLPRRMYENYLLDPEAIAAVYNEVDSKSESPTPITPAKVQEWIQGAKDATEFLDAQHKGRNKKLKDFEWEAYVDGAKLLMKLFQDLSNGQIFFNKPEHSVALTTWLLENRSEALTEVWQLLERVLRRGIEEEL